MRHIGQCHEAAGLCLELLQHFLLVVTDFLLVKQFLELHLLTLKVDCVFEHLLDGLVAE